jgi:hypothetical protein
VFDILFFQFCVTVLLKAEILTSLVVKLVEAWLLFLLSLLPVHCHPYLHGWGSNGTALTFAVLEVLQQVKYLYCPEVIFSW